MVFLLLTLIVFGIFSVIFCDRGFLLEGDFAVLSYNHLQLLVLVVLLADQILVVTSLYIVFGFIFPIFPLIHYFSILSYYLLNLLLLKHLIIFLFIIIVTLLPIVSILHLAPIR